MARRTVRDGSGFEELAGYSRAVRVGAHVAVSGTAALSDGVALYPGDVYAQTREALAKALDAAAELGAGAEDVIRTRLLARARQRLGRSRSEPTAKPSKASTRRTRRISSQGSSLRACSSRSSSTRS